MAITATFAACISCVISPCCPSLRMRSHGLGRLRQQVDQRTKEKGKSQGEERRRGGCLFNARMNHIWYHIVVIPYTFAYQQVQEIKVQDPIYTLPFQHLQQ